MKIDQQLFRDLAQPDEPIKAARVLAYLCRGNSLNRFQAETLLADHTLNSTVSDLANDHGIAITREWEIVPGFNQKPTRCIRYRLDTKPENITRCYWLLRSWGWRDAQLEIDLPPPPEAA